MTRSRRARLLASATSTVVCVAVLSGCSAIGNLGESDQPPAAALPSRSTSENHYPSEFTDDGTFQSHKIIDGLDFVFTIYPTKSTPRTNEWFAKGKKYFSFTFQAYDLRRRLRDPFATKRKVYVDHMAVASTTVTTTGKVQHPYQLDVVARKATFDPEPVTTKYGMIATSPKGAFELRNQEIGPMSLDTRGLNLLFTATVWIQTRSGGTTFEKKQIKQTVPIAIFQSEGPTAVKSIPVDSN